MERDLVRRRTVLASGAAVFGTLAGCRGRLVPDDATETEPSGDRDQDATEAPSSPSDDTEPRSLADVELRGELLADGFVSPVAVSVPQTDRTFVVDQPGQIYLVDDGGRREQPFLDISDQVVTEGNEQGLLGLAFHPQFSDNGRFFVRYSASRRDGTPSDYAHTFVLSEFHAEPGATTADASTETTIMEIPQPQSNHNAGAITFGPDGLLYVATGDGGGAGDSGTGHADDWYDELEGGNGQNVTENLLGGILRLGVDDAQGDRNYAIPDDNPLVDAEGRDEYFAWGLRNPWRMSFGPDGRLFAADVGQDAYEEVNVVERGGNYGWNVREGSHCYDRDTCPGETPDGEPLVPPVIEYPHEGADVTGVSVIGGYLYDGERMPDLSGTYVFADWRANGELFVAEERDEGLWPITTVPVEDVGPSVLSFGRDSDGELLVCSVGRGEEPAGAVHRLESV